MRVTKVAVKYVLEQALSLYLSAMFVAHEKSKRSKKHGRKFQEI